MSRACKRRHVQTSGVRRGLRIAALTPGASRNTATHRYDLHVLGVQLAVAVLVQQLRLGRKEGVDSRPLDDQEPLQLHPLAERAAVELRSRNRETVRL